MQADSKSRAPIDPSPRVEDYRARLYSRYVHARASTLAPATLAGLAPRAPYLKQLIRRQFPVDRQAPILEIGCGHGALLHFARQAGYTNLRGVDASAEQVAAAHHLGIREVQQGELLQTLKETPDRSCAVVIAFDVLEHFTRSELLTLTDEVARVLDVGGRWIIHVPNGESPFGGRIRFGDFTHELAFTRDSIAQLLLASGFAGVRCFEDSPIVHGAISALRWGLWKAIRTVWRICLAAETGDSGRNAIFSQNLLAVAVRA